MTFDPWAWTWAWITELLTATKFTIFSSFTEFMYHVMDRMDEGPEF